MLGELVPRLAGFRPPLAPDPFESARHLDHRAAGLALLGVRDPQPADRAVRRAGRARVRVPDARAARRRGRGRARRARLLAPEGGVRARARALRHRPRRPRGALRRRGAGRAHGGPRPRPVDGRVVPRPPPRSPARVAGRRPRPAARRPRSSTVSTCTSSAAASIRSRTSRRTTSSRASAWPRRHDDPARHRGRRGRPEAALGRVRGRGARAARLPGRAVGGGAADPPRLPRPAAPSTSPRRTASSSASSR